MKPIPVKELAPGLDIWISGKDGKMKLEVPKDIVESILVTFKDGRTALWKPDDKNKKVLVGQLEEVISFLSDSPKMDL